MLRRVRTGLHGSGESIRLFVFGSSLLLSFCPPPPCPPFVIIFAAATGEAG
jgi:hypothetical protein